MKVVKLSVSLVAIALSTGAMANTVTDTVVNSGRSIFKAATNPAAVSVEVGTLGYGANVAWSANNTTEVVAGWTGGGFDVDATIGGDDSIINWKKVLGDSYANTSGKLKIDVDFSNPYVGVNVRPFANAITVGTGVIFQNNTIDATLSPEIGANKISVNGREYEISQGDLSIKAKSGRQLAPYLTVGFKPNSNKRFGMFGELGAVYTSKWETKVDVVGANAQVIGAGDLTQFKQDLTDKINNDNPEWYPVVKLGATYRF